MRITGGRLAGRELVVPKGPRIRPTQDQVRQALFNLLGDAVKGARVLDLFSGSGALGIEALSRGASHITFVDRSGYCIEAVRANLEKLVGSDSRKILRGEDPLASILRSDVGQALRRLDREGRRFDLVFLDPPYGADLARKTLMALTRCAIVGPAGWVVVEGDKRDPLPADAASSGCRLVLQRLEQYGDTALALYRRQ